MLNSAHGGFSGVARRVATDGGRAAASAPEPTGASWAGNRLVPRANNGSPVFNLDGGLIHCTKSLVTAVYPGAHCRCAVR